MVTTIDIELSRHISRVVPSLFDDFSGRLNETLAKEANGILPLKSEDVIYRAKRFYDAIEAEYATRLNSTIESVKTLFHKSDILFRLYDIHAVHHNYHSITFTWTRNKNEYGFTCTFNSYSDLIEPYFRIGELAACGEFTNGDFIHGTLNLFSEVDRLPDWFITPLKSNA